MIRLILWRGEGMGFEKVGAEEVALLCASYWMLLYRLSRSVSFSQVNLHRTLYNLSFYCARMCISSVSLGAGDLEYGWKSVPGRNKFGKNSLRKFLDGS